MRWGGMEMGRKMVMKDRVGVATAARYMDNVATNGRWDRVARAHTHGHTQARERARTLSDVFCQDWLDGGWVLFGYLGC